MKGSKKYKRLKKNCYISLKDNRGSKAEMMATYCGICNKCKMHAFGVKCATVTLHRTAGKWDRAAAPAPGSCHRLETRVQLPAVKTKRPPEQASSRHKKTVALKTHPTQKTGRRGRGERRKDATNRKWFRRLWTWHNCIDNYIKFK